MSLCIAGTPSLSHCNLWKRHRLPHSRLDWIPIADDAGLSSAFGGRLDGLWRRGSMTSNPSPLKLADAKLAGWCPKYALRPRPASLRRVFASLQRQDALPLAERDVRGAESKMRLQI